MPADVRFSVVRNALERAGYRLTRIHGSHHYFTKAGAQPISIPVHRGKVKPFYARQAERVVQREGQGKGP